MKAVGWAVVAGLVMFYYSLSQTAILILSPFSTWTPSGRLILCAGLSMYVEVAVFFLVRYWEGNL